MASSERGKAQGSGATPPTRYSLLAIRPTKKARRNGRALKLARGRQQRSGRLFLDDRFLVRRLDAAARALGERALDLLDRFGLGDALHRRNLARETVERGLVKLPLRVGLLGLRVRAVEIAHDLGDGDDVAGVDLGLVLLRPARPHGALHAGTPFERLERALDQWRLGAPC